MSNGEILKQLLLMANAEEPPPVKVMIPIMLAAMAEMLQNQKKQDEILEKLPELIGCAVEPIKASVELVKKNILVKLGGFIVEHKKTSAILSVLFFVLANWWFVSGWRRPALQGLLRVLGAPEEWIVNVP